ncbi:CAMK/CAMK1 protein kinase [Kwoniella heveanensis CBS 569]|uniref:CAMK/CAMK1 protein kinase n=1 Tax=Kwoniella heveanensis BCC8398 TaxID=1296120 RepID=A0A1B9GJM0_9TREE|nr:CAMK/CAMK1 protein kinase [Kwoniella heveanensis BCC8398]OCF39999.1 CAMK/CAMK1 protein kinase [Kwoniella heveanensis CBS 569]
MPFDFGKLLRTHSSSLLTAAQQEEEHPHGAHKKKEYVFDKSDPIGRGGYSKVLKAKWKARDGKVVALKVVKKESIKNREEYLTIIDKGFPRINMHPNICAGLDWFETGHKYYVTFPMLTGGELLTRLNSRGRFTEDATKKVLRVILETLEFIHSQGIIHRDMKPDNWLYRTPDSEVDDIVLIDFGIAKVLDVQSDEDKLDQFEAGGTPGYAAPEIFCGTGYGKNSDLFGAGVITYNLLSSWSPWESRDVINLIQETARTTVNFPPEPFEGVSETAKAFVRLLMQPPQRRPSAKQALKHPWLAAPIVSVEQDHILEEHEIDSSSIIQLPSHHTLKPDHPIADQLTANPDADLGDLSIKDLVLEEPGVKEKYAASDHGSDSP